LIYGHDVLNVSSNILRPSTGSRHLNRIAQPTSIYADRHVKNNVAQVAFQASPSNIPSLGLPDALSMSLKVLPKDPFLDDRHSLDHQTGGSKPTFPWNASVTHQTSISMWAWSWNYLMIASITLAQVYTVCAFTVSECLHMHQCILAFHLRQ
jgi:hypothetical protein